MARVAEIIIRLKAQGAQTLGDAAAQIDRLRNAASSSTGATSSAGDALEKFRGRADAVSGVAGKLSLALGVVSPEAQALVNVFADLGDGAVGLAEGAKVSGVSLGTLAAAGAGLAAGLAVVGAAYVSITREMEREAAQAAVNRQVHNDLRDAARELADAQLDAAVAFGRLTEAQAEQQRIARGAQQGVQDYGESLRDQRAELRETIAQNEQLAALGSKGLLDWIPGVEATINAADSLFGWTDAANAARASLDTLADGEERRAAMLKESRTLQQDAAWAERDKAEDLERTTTATTSAAQAEADRARVLQQVTAIADRGLSAEAAAAERARREMAQLQKEGAKLRISADVLAPAIAQLNRELQALAFDSALSAAAAEFEETFAPIPRARSDLEGFYEDLAGIVPPEALTDMEKLTLLAGDLNSALASGRISAEEFTAASEALAAAQSAVGSADAGAAADERAGKVSGAISAVAGGVSGLTGAAASAGPVGMIIAAVVSLVDALGKGLLDDIGKMVLGLLDTVGNLGPIISDFLATTLEPLLISIFENAARLVEGVLGVLIPELIILLADPGLWTDVAIALGKAVWEILKAVVLSSAQLTGIFVGQAKTVRSALSDGAEAVRTKLKDPATWEAVGTAIGELVGGISDAVVDGAKSAIMSVAEWLSTIMSKDFWIDVGQSLVDSVAESIHETLVRIREFFGEDLLKDIVQAFKEGFKAGREDGFSKREKRDGGIFDAISSSFQEGEQSSTGFVGSFAKGSEYVPRDGLAMVHKGERIVRAGDEGRGGGAGVTVNVSGLFLGRPAELGAELDRRFKRYNVKLTARS